MPRYAPPAPQTKPEQDEMQKFLQDIRKYVKAADEETAAKYAGLSPKITSPFQQSDYSDIVNGKAGDPTKPGLAGGRDKGDYYIIVFPASYDKATSSQLGAISAKIMGTANGLYFVTPPTANASALQDQLANYTGDFMQKLSDRMASQYNVHSQVITSNTFGGQVEVVHLHILDTADQMAANIAQAEAAHEKVKDLTPSPVPRIKPLSQMLKEAQQNEPAEQQRLETQKRTQTPPAQTVTPPSTTVQEPGLTPPPVEKPKPVLAPPVDQSALSVSGAPNQMPDQRSSQIAANFEGYYSNQVESIRQKFDELGRWANWDDLRVLTQDYAAINNLKIDLDQQLANQRDPAVRKQYQDRLKADLSDIRSGLPEYLRGSINERGAIDLGQLKSATDSLKAAVQALNVFETDAGKTMLQAQPSAADLSRLQGEFDQLQYSYSNQLSFIMIQRYGPTGEGLSSTREFLGLAPSSDDAGLQYLAIMRDLLTDPAGRTLIEGQWAQFQSKYAQSVDPATGARVSQTAQTLAASTTTVYDAQQNPDGSYSDVLSTRATYDPLGTLMFLRNANRPDMLISDDNVLNEVVRAASLSSLFNTAAIPSTSGAPAQQSNSNSQMPSGLWSQLASDEKFMDLAGRTGDASTQVQLVTSASLLLSRIQSTPAFAYDVRYDKRALLLSKFDGLSLTGNETTDLESKIYYGLPQGHVGIVSPYDFIAKYFPTDYTALGDFARGMWRPVSLWSSTLVPQVQREGQLQQTDLNYLFDLQSYYTRQFYSYMPTARYIQFSYGQNYLGLRANYGMLLGQMNEFFNDVVGTAPISYSPRRYTGQFAAGGSEASTALDAQYYAPGKVIGQQVYADAFYRGATTPGSTYDLSKQTYLPYEASYQREFDAKLLASQMEGLNTRLWQALGTWSQTSANPNEQGGVAGLPLATFSRDVNLSLNSTFPGALTGTVVGFVNERRREDLPTADQATGTVYKPTAEFYNIDLFVKAPPKPGEAEGTWSRIILSEDQQADLLSSATSMAFSAPQIAQLLSATPPIALRPDQITALQGGSTSLLLTPEEAQALIAYAQANPSSPFLTAIQLSQLQLYTAGPTAPGSLQNDIQHYFDQTYTTFGASSRLDAAVEYARRTYLQPGQTAPNLVPGETGIRHGLMLIAQPGLPVAVTYGTTTTGDEVVAFNANTGSHLISGGWYSFNDASLAAYRPQQAMGGLSRYYVPSYRLSEQFPQLSGAQDRFLSMSLLGIDRYRATVLGGWKTQGGAITNAIGGGEFATRDFNAASFLNFDQSGSIVEGLVSAGGRVGAVDFTGYAYRPPAGVSSYGDEQGAIASIRLSKDATLTFYGQGSAAPIRNPAWSPAVMRPLAADIKSLHDDIAATTPLDMLKPASWNATMRDFMTRSGGLAARTFGQSFDDLFFANWIAALSAGYVDKTTDVKMTWGLTNNGSFLSAMSDFDKNVAIVAGMRITDQATPAPEVVTDSYNPYLWMAGLKWKPKNFAFGFYTAQALDQQTIGTIQAGVPDVITAAVSRSISTTSAAQSQFWLAGMQIGPEKSMGIVNYSISPDLQDVELGARFAMSSDFYLAAAYQNLKFFQKPGQAQGAMTKADFDAAQQLLGAQGMMPDNIASQGLKFDLRYQMGANAWLSGTGSMRFMDKGPYDWYAGIRISAAP